MTLTVRPCTSADAPAWDAFCAGALQATLLHTRAFLAYHGARFDDQSIIIEDDGEWVGLLPAARDPANAARVASHPGATYGGVVHRGHLRGEAMLDALVAVAAHYRASGFASLLYKAVPGFYHKAPAQDDLYALFRLGARRVRCDLSSTIDLQQRLPMASRRQRALKKATAAGLTVSDDADHVGALWAVLQDNLARKHGVQPVHSLAEIAGLIAALPGQLRLCCALDHGQVVAGVLLFATDTCWHAQYIAASEQGYAVNALDAVFDHCVRGAAAAGKRWFDFGISTESGGQVLNAGLYDFKSGFGGGGTLHEFFELTL